MRKDRKYLTKENYTSLLRLIGLSNRPLSSNEIKKELEKYGLKETESQYVYEMLKELMPDRRSNDSFLLKPSELLQDKMYTKELINNLNRCLDLGWSKEEVSKNVTFKKVESTIKIEHAKKNTTIILKRSAFSFY